MALYRSTLVYLATSLAKVRGGTKTEVRIYDIIEVGMRVLLLWVKVTLINSSLLVREKFQQKLQWAWGPVIKLVESSDKSSKSS